MSTVSHLSAEKSALKLLKLAQPVSSSPVDDAVFSQPLGVVSMATAASMGTWSKLAVQAVKIKSTFSLKTYNRHYRVCSTETSFPMMTPLIPLDPQQQKMSGVRMLNFSNN